MTLGDRIPVSILYVDDEIMLLDLAKTFLERMGTFAVTNAGSVPQALAFLESSPFDVIVSDYQMPETDGIEFLKLVRRRYPDIPFILFTGRGREEVVIQAINNGAAFYLQKGGDATAQFAELAHKIRQAVAQARAEKALLKNFIALQEQEQVLRERRNFYRAVFENTGTAMLVIDEDTVISHINAEFERLAGYTRAEIEGKKRWPEFVDGGDREQMLVWHRLRREGVANVPLDYEFTLVRRSGERRRIHLTVDLIAGTKTSVASLLDITGRIRAEDALRQSEALHRTVFEISPDPITLIDADGTIIQTSSSSLRLFGLGSTDEAIGTPLFDWIAPEVRSEVRKHVLAFIRSPASPSIARVFPLVKKDGTRFLGEISSSVVQGTGGRPNGMISIIRDVTERVRTERALTRANEKLGLLATVTRHDILSRLSILLGYLELAEEEDDPAILKNYIGKIRKAADTLEAQVQFSRDYQNVGIDSPCWQNVPAVLRDLAPVSDSGTVRISDRSGTLEVFADPLFAKAVHNLLDNALRHGGPRLTEVTIRYENADPGLLLFFEDNGAGIPSADKEKIFAKGYGKHNGLGLFVVREILAITGMAISETGTPGEGARFVIRIPAGHYRFAGPA